MKKTLLDCDPGMDDSVAIMLAMKSKEIDLLAVTTVNGNYPVAVTSANARKILELIGAKNIPVYKGMANPMADVSPKDPFTHGKDGLAETGLPMPEYPLEADHAVNAIREIIENNPGEVSIVCTGPMTNVGMAISMYPEIKSKIKEIVAISGAFGLNSASFLNATGDTPQSEWNVYVDPHAASLVYCSGIPLRLIGLDIATDFGVDFSDMDLTRLSSSPQKGAWFLSKAISFVKDKGFAAYCAVIDCMAIAALIDENIVSFSDAFVGVDTRPGITYGMTVRDGRHHFAWKTLPCVKIATSARYDRFLALIVDLLVGDKT